jgi:hypothetical protein
LVVLCVGSMLLLAQTSHHQRLLLASLPKSASTNLLKWFLSPTGRLNLVSYWGKTYCYAHHTFLLGFPNCSCETSHVYSNISSCWIRAANESSMTRWRGMMRIMCLNMLKGLDELPHWDVVVWFVLAALGPEFLSCDSTWAYNRAWRCGTLVD